VQTSARDISLFIHETACSNVTVQLALRLYLQQSSSPQAVNEVSILDLRDYYFLHQHVYHIYTSSLPEVL